MYERYFYLKEKPFHVTPDTRFLYLTKKHSAALDLMTYGVRDKKGFVMLTGEVGMGKTTLCRALIETLPENIETALILNPVLSGFELLKTITADFGLMVNGDTVKGHLDRLYQFLLKTASAGGGAAVIIDEAQLLTPRTLEMLRLLSNLETRDEKLLQIVLAGQPELKKKLEMPALRQLNQRVIVRYNIEPLDYPEMRDYIRTRLFIASGGGGGVRVEFSEKALRRIFKKSLGVPRMINIICDRALAAAFVSGRKSCDCRSVVKAVEELEKDGLVAAPRAPSNSPAYIRYFPHLALSLALIAVIAGIFILGAGIYNKKAALAVYIP